jgi:hypothetical protein
LLTHRDRLERKSGRALLDDEHGDTTALALLGVGDGLNQGEVGVSAQLTKFGAVDNQ